MTSTDGRPPVEACKNYDPELWHPLPKQDAIEQQAKRICWQECPVRAKCLNRSFSFGVPHGIWGGLNEEERKDLFPAWLALQERRLLDAAPA